MELCSSEKSLVRVVVESDRDNLDSLQAESEGAETTPGEEETVVYEEAGIVACVQVGSTLVEVVEIVLVEAVGTAHDQNRLENADLEAAHVA